jgi:hypothetical protein
MEADVEDPPPGLPDGIFSNQKAQFGQFWECLAMEDVSKFYSLLGLFSCHLLNFLDIWYTL